uniref:Dynein heavy chain C-terminal domain-containing protein n=1 Tax=Oryzias melastigma TaxID=30732 RepID=A0A3B3B6P5_ORYME
YLEGAANASFTESKISEMMPVIWMYGDNNCEGSLYSCPILEILQTDVNCIASVELKTTLPPQHWVLRAVAPLCDVK